MKKFAGFVFLNIILSIAFYSCGDKNEERLLGKWKLVNREIVCDNPEMDSMETESRLKQGFPAMSLAEQAETAVRKEEAYTFHEDGRYTEEDNEGRNMEGKYEVKDSGIIFSSMRIVTKVYTFKTFNDSILEVSSGIGMRGHNHTYHDRLRKAFDE